MGAGYVEGRCVEGMEGGFWNEKGSGDTCDKGAESEEGGTGDSVS